jgi:hypothetical protein
MALGSSNDRGMVRSVKEQVPPVWVFHQDHTGGHWEAPYAGHWKLKVVYQEDAARWRAEATPEEEPQNHREEWVEGSGNDPAHAMACARELADTWPAQNRPVF